MKAQTMNNLSPQPQKIVGRFLIVSFSTALIYLALSLLATPFNFQEQTRNGDRSSENSVGYLALGLISGFGVSGLYGFQLYKRYKEQVNQIQQRLQEKQQNLSNIEKQLEQQKQTHQTLNTTLVEKDQKLVKQKQELEEKLQQQESQYLQELDNLMQVEDELQQQLKEQESDYNQQIEELLNTTSVLEAQVVEQRDRAHRIQEKLQASLNSLKQASQNCLSPFKITLVGGHKNACEEVAKTLKEEYGVKECNIIPHQGSLPNDQTIKSKTKDADFVFVITGYNRHSLSKKVSQLKNTPSLKGKLIYLSNIRGASGIVQNILDELDVPAVFREKVTSV